MAIDKKISGEHVYRMTISSLTSIMAVLAVVYTLLMPAVIVTLSDAMAEDINATVSQQVAPINNAFVALLQRDINSIRKDIAELEYRQQAAADWSVKDAQELAELEIDLEALREARKELMGNNKS